MLMQVEGVSPLVFQHLLMDPLSTLDHFGAPVERLAKTRQDEQEYKVGGVEDERKLRVWMNEEERNALQL